MVNCWNNKQTKQNKNTKKDDGSLLIVVILLTFGCDLYNELNIAWIIQTDSSLMNNKEIVRLVLRKVRL